MICDNYQGRNNPRNDMNVMSIQGTAGIDCDYDDQFLPPV